jgi:hypothetical protein
MANVLQIIPKRLTPAAAQLQAIHSAVNAFGRLKSSANAADFFTRGRDRHPTGNLKARCRSGLESPYFPGLNEITKFRITALASPRPGRFR